MSAWKEACASPQPSQLVIPGGTYMVGPVTFQGPCKAPITIQSQGNWKAPTDLNKLKSQDGWIVFQNIDALTLSGGTFDGQGEIAWSQNDCAKTGKCSSLPIVNPKPNFLHLNFHSYLKMILQQKYLKLSFERVTRYSVKFYVD